MSTYLVVAHQTVRSPELLRALEEKAGLPTSKDE